MTTEVELIKYITTTFITADKNIDQLSADDNLLLSGLIDSLGVMQLVAHLQTENDIKIEPREITLKNFKTAKAILNFLETKKVTA